MTITSERTGSPWILAPAPRPQARLSLFCFHHAGGGASLFRSWSAMLPDDIAAYPVQLPGRETRFFEPLVPQITQLAKMLAEELYPYMSGGPFAFFGHSMGALVAFEFARELRRQGKPLPEHLFVSASRAPQDPPQRPHLHKLSDTQLIRALLHIDETQREMSEDKDLQTLLLPIIRSDFSLCETYDYQKEECLPLPITAFGGRQDIRVNCEELESWGLQTAREFKLHLLSGGHFYLQHCPKALLQIIGQELAPYVQGGCYVH